MTDTLVQIIFGWPAIIATLLVSIAGLVWKRYWLLLVGALLFFPFSLYLSGLPATRGLGLFLPVFQAGAISRPGAKISAGLGTGVARFHCQRLAGLYRFDAVGIV
jgi:hypothetical protein